MRGDTLLEIEALTKVYRSRRRGDVRAVDGVSFRVGASEVVGLLGPNGAGKTTTIKCLSTIVRPTSGRIALDGVDAVRHPRAAVEKVAAVLEGNRNIYWRLTVRENLEFFAALQGLRARAVRASIDELIGRFGLGDKARTPARMLSKGMQQKLALACAFVKETPLLVLDEPTLGLDVESSHDLRVHIKEAAAAGGRTILLSSHDMDVVQDVCERVVIVNGGRVVTDDRVANLLELFGARAYRFTIAGPVGGPLGDALRVRFPLLDARSDPYRSEIDVELPDGAGFYDLVDILRESRSVVESIDRRDPNLEEIFLKIVTQEAPQGGAR
ncbi:MAG: ABC transporter ATP-binding protein [Acidobacteria bacterium]|nr:ABC transporter ATP-binding protein [Acidobacteriota bacterium]